MNSISSEIILFVRKRMINAVYLSIFLYVLSTPVFAQQTLINLLDLETSANKVQLVFSTTSLPQYKVFFLKKPNRLVIDLFNSRFDRALVQPKTSHPFISGFRSSVRNKTDLRIVADLKTPIHFEVRALNSDKEKSYQLRIDLIKQIRPLSKKPNLADQRINKLTFKSFTNYSQLIFSSNSRLQYHAFLLRSPNRIVFDFSNTRLETPLVQPSIQHPFIFRLRSSTRNKTDLRIVADLKTQIQFKANTLKLNNKMLNQLIFDLYKKQPSQRINPIIRETPKTTDHTSKNFSTKKEVALLSRMQSKNQKTSSKPSKINTVDFDDPPNTSHRLTSFLSFGSNFELQYEIKKNYGLSPTKDDNLEEIKPSANFAFLYQTQKSFHAFIEFNLTHGYLINHPEQSRRRETVFSINQAYFIFKDVYKGVTLQIGRQRHKDPREWWYDENLDAIRLFYNYHSYGIEFSVGREEIIGNDLLNEDSQKEINNYLIAAHYKFNKKNQLNSYFLFMDDHSKRKTDSLYFGMQSLGKITSSLKYWLDAAGLFGSTKTKDLQAYAFDIGATYAPKINYKPSLTLGVAFGSGDNNRDKKDETFRQTGFEDNNGKFNGVTKFKYYGELLDPELSNLLIVTAGLGLKPMPKSSIDFVYHYYRQDHLDDRFRSDLLIDPDGKNKDLGHELDIVLGFRGIKNLSTEFIFGVFIPGAAFSDSFNQAFFGKIEIAYRY